MLVIKGPQGVGKSTFCRSLCRNLGSKYFHAGFIDPSNKDHSIKRVSSFIWEVDELSGTMHNSDLNKLKAFITQNEVKDRLPYAKFASNYKVNANFIGTVNDDEFLKDTTGNRRYLVFEINEFNFNYLKTFDVDALWGEAMVNYNLSKDEITGDVLMLPKEKEQQISRNEGWREKSGIELLLEGWIVKDEKGYLTSAEILSQLKGNQNSINTSDNLLKRQIIEAMSGLKFVKTQVGTSRVSGYKNCKFSNKLGNINPSSR
jgi:predicted P-loop ATPase